MATGKEFSIAEKLKSLFQLQQIDSKIDVILRMRGELPMEVTDLEDEIIGLETRISHLEYDMSAYKNTIVTNENGIKESEALIAKYEKNLNTVRNNREYDSLTKEVEMQNLEIQLCRKKINDAISASKEKDLLLKDSKDRLKERQIALEIKKKELEMIYKETEKEEQDLLKKSQQAQSNIEERLLSAYQRIRRTYNNGLAVASIQRDSCGGCFASVPAQRKLEISQRKKIIVCEHCGRILVDGEIDQA